MVFERFYAIRSGAALLSAGALMGVTGALFLQTLTWADTARIALVDAAVRHMIPGWLVASLTGLIGVAAASWCARRFAKNAPQSYIGSHSGKAETRTPVSNALLVNFGGSALAVGAGLALGPERPAIQMGGAIGRTASRFFGLNRADHHTMMAATGGAGVATMFNSPLGCAAYAVEVVLKRVDLRVSLTTLAVGAIAVAVMRFVLGRDVNFVVGDISPVSAEYLVVFVVMGCVISVFAYLHVHLIMMLARFIHRVRIPAVIRGAVVGATVGLLAWYTPGVVGTGDALTQGVIDGKFALSTMAVFFLVRFFLGPLSLAASTPGGYFTPVMLLGALFGAMFGVLVGEWMPGAPVTPAMFALVGMAVALTAVANAPFTGILLVMEMTGAYDLALPMIFAVMGAGIITRLLHTPTMSHGLEIALSASAKHPAKATGPDVPGPGSGH